MSFISRRICFFLLLCSLKRYLWHERRDQKYLSGRSSRKKTRSELSAEEQKVERGAAQSKFEADRKLIILTILDRAKYLLTHGVLLNWRWSLIRELEWFVLKEQHFSAEKLLLTSFEGGPIQRLQLRLLTISMLKQIVSSTRISNDWTLSVVSKSLKVFKAKT